MKIFFDSEFTGLHQKTTLISIGFIAENDDKFYAEFTDYDEGQLDDWLRENVVANLFAKSPEYGYGDLLVPGDTWIGDSAWVKKALFEWFEKFDKIELWSDCLSYDWVLLSELIADRSNGYPELPSNFTYHSPFDILPLIAAAGIDLDITREDLAGIKDEGRKHNALWDAEVIRACYERVAK